MNKHFLSLAEKAKTLLDENRYVFSETDKVLLQKITEELEELSQKPDGTDYQKELFDIVSLILRYLKFFGINDITDLF